jgi:predicted DsbA family dithiol-disulfide isomerase
MTQKVNKASLHPPSPCTTTGGVALSSELSEFAKRFLLASALVFLAGASCEKSKAASDTGAIAAADNAKRPLDMTPIEGIDVGRLSEKQQKVFYKLVDAFSSPCGKAHSLRTSVQSDEACRSAPFAARYLAAMVEDDATEKDIRDLWERKYKKWNDATSKRKKFRLDGVPHAGPADAPVKFVEFFDYGCPACQAIKPVIDEVMAEHGRKEAAFYYKMYPLTEIHPNSMSAAKAALAAHQQGKFKAMHDLLFARSPDHKRSDVMAYARQIGLDMARFERDYDAAEAQVKADMREGDAAGVTGTPSIFMNGRPYEGPSFPEYFGYWITEEIAVNR